MKPIILNQPYREWEREQRRIRLYHELTWLALGLALIAMGMGLGWIVCKF